MKASLISTESNGNQFTTTVKVGASIIKIVEDVLFNIEDFKSLCEVTEYDFITQTVSLTNSKGKDISDRQLEVINAKLVREVNQGIASVLNTRYM